jgi:hypothetical protein
MVEQPQRLEESVSNVFDAVPDEARLLIIEELERRNPVLLEELRRSVKPTTAQSDGLVLGVLAAALRENFGPEYVPNERGRAIERAIDAYLEAWPVQR